MEYNQAIEYLNSREKLGIHLGLDNISSLLSLLGNPQRKFKSILIGGTNGKGSTAAMIHAILSKAGFKVGLYTSPHLIRFTERIKINHNEISEGKIAQYISRIKQCIETSKDEAMNSVTFFEFATAIAFLYCAEEAVDIAVVEVGMGGRLDATNLLQPIVSIITNVSMDHQDYLGHSILSIAKEKAGIIKSNSIVITGVKQPSVLGLFKQICQAKNSRLYALEKDFLTVDNPNGGFNYCGIKENYPNISLNLIGSHQMDNAALVLATVEILKSKGFKIANECVLDALKDVDWPGRFEILGSAPRVILDGAHNADGVNVLCKTLNSNFPNQRKILIFGVCRDKEYRTMLSTLAHHFEYFIFTQAKNYRALPVSELMNVAGELGIRNAMAIPEVCDALDYAHSLCGGEDIICVTGSLFLVGEIREILSRGTLQRAPTDYIKETICQGY